jgi:hypothetical protein
VIGPIRSDRTTDPRDTPRGRDGRKDRAPSSWAPWILVCAAGLIIQSDLATGDYVHAAIWVPVALSFARRAHWARREDEILRRACGSDADSDGRMGLLPDWSLTLRVWWAWLWRSVVRVVSLMVLTSVVGVTFQRVMGRAHANPFDRHDPRVVALICVLIFVGGFLAFRSVLRKTFRDFDIRVDPAPLPPNAAGVPRDVSWRDALLAYVNIAVPAILVYMALQSVLHSGAPWLLILAGAHLGVLHLGLTRKIPMRPLIIVLAREPRSVTPQHTNPSKGP